MDIGTNSIRLLLVRLHPNHSYTMLTQLKEIVRLGEGEFTHRHLQPQAIARAVLVAKQFAGLARRKQELSAGRARWQGRAGWRDRSQAADGRQGEQGR